MYLWKFWVLLRIVFDFIMEVIMRKTKIVCTIGPACNNKETLLEMINAGMNVARINMSHGAYDDLENTFNVLKEAIADAHLKTAV